MLLWLVATVMLLAGSLIVVLSRRADGDDRPMVYWLAWGMVVGGLLVLTSRFNPLRETYVGWSTALAVILTVLFLAGKVNNRFLPAAWCGVGILAANVLLVALGRWLPTNMLGLGFAVFSVGLLLLGYRLRTAGNPYYDAAYSTAAMSLVLGALLSTHTIRTPLEHLNEVAIPHLNQAFTAAQTRLTSYDRAIDQARQYRAQIDTQFGAEEAANLEIADRYIETATTHHSKAQQLVHQLGAPEQHVAAYDTATATRIQERTEQAKQAAETAQLSLDQLDGVRKHFENLSQEWIKEYLWFEVDGFWTSEENESPSYDVCYYGERFSVRAEDDVREEIVSDEADRTGSSSLFDSDRQGVDWKYFTVEDYNELVNTGLVPASSSTIFSDTEAGYYLCGTSPQTGQYGALGEPVVVIEKGYGSLRREIGDEGASFVGDERYGTWCTVGSDGQTTPVPEGQEPPVDAKWCWYQKPGDATDRYWERRLHGNTVMWVSSHRRCVYCAPQTRWAGPELVPDSEMARANGTDGSTTRGPLDQGGGPGTGK